MKSIFKKKKKFPTLAVILLIFAITWALSDLGYLSVDLPWIPIILGIVALGWIVDRYAS